MSAKGTTADTKGLKGKDLLGTMDPKLDREVREKLITARVGLYYYVLVSLVT